MHPRCTNGRRTIGSLLAADPRLRTFAFTIVEASEVAAAAKSVTPDSAIRMPAVSVAPKERSLIARESNEYFVIVGLRRQLATRSFCVDFLAELGRQLCPRSLGAGVIPNRAIRQLLRAALESDRLDQLNDVLITALDACFAISPSRTGHRLR